MTSMTVKEFALELKLPVKTLLAQLRAAGVSKDAENDVLSDEIGRASCRERVFRAV